MPVLQSNTKTLKSAFSIDSLMKPDRERHCSSPDERSTPPRGDHQASSSNSSSPVNCRLSPPNPLMGGAGSSFHVVNSLHAAAKARAASEGGVPHLPGVPDLRHLVFPTGHFPPSSLPQQMTLPPGYNPLLHRDPLYFYNPLLLCNHRSFLNQRLTGKFTISLYSLKY